MQLLFEEERQTAIQKLSRDDGQPDERFDDILSVAKGIAGPPVVLLTE